MGAWIGRFWQGAPENTPKKQPLWLEDLQTPRTFNYAKVITNYQSPVFIQLQFDSLAFTIMETVIIPMRKYTLIYQAENFTSARRQLVAAFKSKTPRYVAKKILGRYLGGNGVTVYSFLVDNSSPIGLINELIQPIKVAYLVVFHEQRSTRWLNSIKSAEVAEVRIVGKNVNILKHPVIKNANELSIECKLQLVIQYVYLKINHQNLLFVNFFRNRRQFKWFCSHLRTMNVRMRVAFVTTGEQNSKYIRYLREIEGSRTIELLDRVIIIVPMENRKMYLVATFNEEHIVLRVSEEEDYLVNENIDFLSKWLRDIFLQDMKDFMLSLGEKSGATAQSSKS